MFSLGDHLRYHVYNSPADMRKGFNGLYGLVRTELGHNPLSGDVFVFINRKRTQIKLLQWEPGGLVCYHKRLEQGSFAQLESRGSTSLPLTWRELELLVDGIVVKKLIRRKRLNTL